MKKFLLTIGILGIIMMGRVSAANDCNIVIGSGIDESVNAYGIKYINILPSTGFKQTLINLKAHCCGKNLITCTQKEKENLPKSYFPQSEFLFDHLIDVSMRRLDGITGLAYSLPPDPTGLERRTKITEIAKSATGAQAREIESMYTGYRTLHKYADSVSCTPDLNVIISGYNKNIATVSLGDKYNTICELMKNIYNETPNSDKTLITEGSFNKCTKMIKERVKREEGYTKILMVQKSNQLLDETTKGYTKKYFVQEKLMALWGLIDKVKDVFKTIVQQAPASKTCSK